MAFGWSAGDILSAINFIIEIANALDEVDGAAKQFREASVFLRDLNTTLKPLQTFTVLDTKPTYKKEIENQVEAIRTPIETFINDDDVKALQKSLGVVNTGHFRTFRDVKNKLKWQFSTSEKALNLQKVWRGTCESLIT
jgi:rubrerythrin